VLAWINKVLAEHSVNIVGQVLGTRGEVGYVLTDFGSPLDQQMLAALENRDETIRLRIC